MYFLDVFLVTAARPPIRECVHHGSATLAHIARRGRSEKLGRLAAVESDLGGRSCAVFGFCRLRPSQLLDKIQNRATPLAKEVTPFASGCNCQANRLQAFIAKAIDGKHCAGLWRHRLDQHRQPLGTGSEHSAEKTIGYRGRSFRLMACHSDSPPFLPRLLAS